ncbi:Golgin subfamily A member 7 [Aphelenchoides avenae]|nr:Golgin subfamily A member 7 [Aphelenchus avenae]
MVRPAAVSLDSCRKIFVDRDYSDGLGVKFVGEFPAALEGIISHEDWDDTIDTINSAFAEAEEVCWSSVLETLVSFCTCYLTRLCLKTRYEKQLAKIREFIEDRNRKVFLPVGLCMSDPMDKGLRVLEISILSTGKVRLASGLAPRDYADPERL